MLTRWQDYLPLPKGISDIHSFHDEKNELD
jgi:hypothetical protein